MKQLLKPFLIAALALPTLAFAETAPQTTTIDKVKAATGAAAAEVEIKNQTTSVTSPRTGITYTLGNTGGRTIILKTSAISAVTPVTASRIVASNPALSASSQEKAKQALLDGNTIAAN